MDITKAVFVRSAASERDFPRDSGKRIIFAGKSNVGKSSTINRIFQKKNFAKVSASPGKTIYVNLFRLEDKYWFVDLPGYGYAKTSKAEKERFSKLIESFLSYDNDKIARFYLIDDSRHRPTQLDVQMMEWIRAYGLPFTVIANKTDKLKPREIEENAALIRETLGLEENERLLMFSAEKGTGRLDIIKDIETALEG